MVVRLSALRTRRTLLPRNIIFMLLVLISVTAVLYTAAIVGRFATNRIYFHISFTWKTLCNKWTNVTTNTVLLVPHVRICTTDWCTQAHTHMYTCAIYQRHSTFLVRVPPDVISLELCTPRSCWCNFKLYTDYNLHLK
jgi:hypothetical protein